MTTMMVMIIRLLQIFKYDNENIYSVDISDKNNTYKCYHNKSNNGNNTETKLLANAVMQVMALIIILRSKNPA